jgi:uncharacterized phage protein gp47/JayE
MAGFEIRRWEGLTQKAIDWIQSNPDAADGVIPSDLFVGSLERSHIEAVALLMEELDVRAAQAISWAVQESAFRAFGFTLLPAKAATGSVVFMAVVPPALEIEIPQGTKVVSKGGQVFITTAPGVIAVGEYASAEIPVVAAVPGPDGNVPTEDIAALVYPIAGVDGVTNYEPMRYGSPEEGDTARRARFVRYIRSLPRGTVDALEFAAESTGVVASAKCVEPWALNPIPAGSPAAGVAYLYVDDGVGGPTLLPDVEAAVRETVNGYIDGDGRRVPGWKAAGIPVLLYPVQQKGIKLRATVRVAPAARQRWSSVAENLSAAATAYFASLGIAQPVSYQDLFIALTLCDDAIVSVALSMWPADSVAPGYDAPLSADDIQLSDSTTAAGYGVRHTLFSGQALEPSGAVDYPEWRLAP